MQLDKLKITVRRQLCLMGLSEDSIQEFVDNLQIGTTDDNTTFVTSKGGIEVQFLFGSDGNFNGVYAQLGGVSIPILFGTGSSNLELFRDAPSASNPGPGWTVDVERSKAWLHQSGPEANWTGFVAYRVPIVSTIP